MNTTTITRTLLAAAALTIGGLSAQPMTAKIPFKFEVPGAVLPSGEYEITVERHISGNPGVKFWNWKTNKGAIVLASAAGAPVVADSNTESSLGFTCTPKTCQLSTIKPAGRQSFRVPTRRPAENEEVLLTMVPILRASR